jgi:hypothetical protein
MVETPALDKQTAFLKKNGNFYGKTFAYLNVNLIKLIAG